MTNEKKFLYAVEPFTWRKSPSGDWDEYEYPRGTKVEIIGIGPRGYNVRIVETGVEMYETGLMKWTNKPELIETNMTNEEKAREIATINHDEYVDKKDSFHSLAICEKSALEMAEWKEQQFKNILKQKLAQYHKKWELSTKPDDQLVWGGKEDAIGLLLVELFGADGIDYSNRDK